MGKNKGVARAEAGTGEDAGSKYVREGESFCPRDTRAFKHRRPHREARERAERDSITITAHGGARGYSRIRVGDGAQSLSKVKAQGDG